MRLFLLICSFLTYGCAGPTTPFGSNFIISNEYQVNFKAPVHSSITRTPSSNSDISEKVNVTSTPQQQRYHTPFDLKIKINSITAISKDFRYEILYNGRKVDSWWRSEEIEIDPINKRKATIIFKRLSLIPGIHNDITFLFYPSAKAKPIKYQFESPSCDFDAFERLGNLYPFNKHKSQMSSITKFSKDYEINPSLLAALVAQESGFNHQALSYAKALGLTQVTGATSKDILAVKKNWQTYPNINRLNYVQLFHSIKTGKINGNNEWRLNKMKSIEGGALYLNRLRDYWLIDHNYKILTKTFKNIPFTDVILASYNSGAYRVKQNIREHNNNWLWSKELGEARKYVMNIKSYCGQFKQTKNKLAFK